MKIKYRLHAVERMFERNISVDEVKMILNEGKIINEYPDDKPFPSKLILGFINNRPLHLVTAENKNDEEIIIITVYEPDKDQWDEKFERKIK